MEEKPRLVYVCEGGDCSERGSVEMHNELKALLEEKDPGKKNKLRKYPCFGGCEQGVNVALYPDRVFYSQVKMEDMARLSEHLCNDGPELKDKKGIVAPDIEGIVWELMDTGF